MSGAERGATWASCKRHRLPETAGLGRMPPVRGRSPEPAREDLADLDVLQMPAGYRSASLPTRCAQLGSERGREPARNRHASVFFGQAWNRRT